MDFFTVNFIAFSLVALIIFKLVKGDILKKNTLLLISLIYLSTWSWQASVVVIINSAFITLIAKYVFKNKKVLAFGIFVQLLLIISSRFIFEFKSNEIYQAFIFNSVWFIGVSYYALQNISYLIDSFYEKIEKLEWNELLLSNIYFPKLLVGPIEKPILFINKLSQRNNYSYWRSLYLISIGVFKRLVISVRIMDFYQQMRESYTEGTPLVVYWTIAILGYITLYIDFSAYMNIGQGISLLFGIELEENFDRPYTAISPVDYWKKWHITLSNWIKEYVYYPVLVKSKNLSLAVVISFLIVGAWHGLKKELIFWAIAWSIYQIIYVKLKEKKLLIDTKNILLKYFLIFINFNIVAIIGLYSYYLMFFKFEKPLWTNVIDSQGVFLYQQNFLLLLFILVLFILEKLDSMYKNETFYINASVFLVFINAAYMFSSSYLFYYMRI